MIPQKKYLSKYLKEAAIEEIIDKYKNNGYELHRNYKINNFNADLVVQKDDRTYIFEFKSTETTKDSNADHNYSDLKNYLAENKNSEFRFSYVDAPKERNVEIEGLEDIILQYLTDNTLSEIDNLSTHSTVSEVSDIDIEDILISKKNINIKGYFSLGLELQFGSDRDVSRDNGLVTNESFAVRFDLCLNRDLEIDEINIKIESFEEE